MSSIAILVNLVESRNLLKEKVISPVALSESTYNLVHTVGNDLIVIKALIKHDSEPV